jgi:paired amphipathic helix protein Sin3a
MRSLFLSVLALSAAVSSQLVVPLHRGPSRRPPAPPSLQPFDRDQIPLMDPGGGPGPAMPPSRSSPADPPSSPVGGAVMLSDVMGRDRSINLFAG